MVAVIKPGHSIYRPFNYNENKVAAGVAHCIDACNYPIDHDQMSVGTKIGYLEQRLAMNENVKCNSVHISLNFDPSEANLSDEKMAEIAAVYLQNLGFGQQPYLVYRHFDAGHPHLHIVTTNIKSDGKRIELHRLASLKSEPSRKLVEEQFNLVRAQGQKQLEPYSLQPISVAKVINGKSETKKAIQTVLDHVLGNYKFCSLPELNAVLNQYNVVADRGSKDSRTFKQNGLMYKMLDENGKPVGVPIKASSFYSSPTLKTLEKKYAVNERKRAAFKVRVKNSIELAFKQKPKDLAGLLDILEKRGIHANLRKSDTGQVFGITYIDNVTKCVFNGSALGKPYAAKAILERFRVQPGNGSQMEDPRRRQVLQQLPVYGPSLPPIFINAVDGLFHTEQGADYVPPQPGVKRRRKKRRKNRN